MINQTFTNYPTKSRLLLALKEKTIYGTLFISLIIFLGSCSLTKKNYDGQPVSSLSFLSEYTVPNGYTFQNTTVGGLSGIDYDARKNQYYMICDDRSDINPVRYYTANITVEGNKIAGVNFTNVTFLKDRSGKLYPSYGKNPSQGVDPEALRNHAATNTMVWSSEGDRLMTPKDTSIVDPFVATVTPDGKWLDTFALPAQFKASKFHQGIRRNAGFEGMSFDFSGKHLYVNAEEPLLQDGERAGLHDSAAVIRIIKYDVKTRQPIAQYAYPIDPVVRIPEPINGFRLNGVSDILWAGNNQLFVVERSFSAGKNTSNIRVYLADLNGAEDVSNVPSFGKTIVKPVSKRLLFNMDNLQIDIDNIEGVTWGPRLANGKRSIIFVADNNFNRSEMNQFLLFEVN